MKSSNLITLLGSFSLKEIKEFSEFVQSPFYNKNENVTKLFFYLRKCYPDFDEQKILKESVYKKLFSKGKYDDGFMRTLIFALNNLAEEFLIIRNLQKDKIKKSINLLDELSQRALTKSFKREIKNTSKILETVQYKYDSFYYYKYMIEYLGLITDKPNLRYLNTTDKPTEELQNETQYLIRFFMEKLLFRYNWVTNFSFVLKFDFEFKFDFLEEVLNYVAKNYDELDDPILKVYYNELMMMRTNEKKYFDFLFNVLKEYGDKLKWSDRFRVISLLENFAIRQTYRGSKDYKDIRVDINKYALAEKLYSMKEGGYFDDYKFNNVINLAIRTGNLKWAEEIIENYKETLDPDFADTILKFNKSKIEFAKKNYEEALNHLSRITNVFQIHYKLGIKNSTLKIYYELGWYRQAFDLIESFRKFLSTDKLLNDEIKDRYKNFVNIFRDLLKLKESCDKKKFIDLEFRLNSEKNISEVEWFKRKLKEIKV